MMSLTKNLKPKTKKMFSLQTTRLAESFELFNSSLALTMPEFCTHLAMCKQAVYMQMA